MCLYIPHTKREATATITATPIRNSNTLRAPKSSRSNSTPGVCSFCISSVMCRFQNFVGEHVVCWYQRHRPQIAEEKSQPQSAHRNRNHHIGPSHAECLRKIRLDYPEEINVAHEH